MVNWLYQLLRCNWRCIRACVISVHEQCQGLAMRYRALISAQVIIYSQESWPCVTWGQVIIYSQESWPWVRCGQVIIYSQESWQYVTCGQVIIYSQESWPCVTWGQVIIIRTNHGHASNAGKWSFIRKNHGHASRGASDHLFARIMAIRHVRARKGHCGGSTHGSQMNTIENYRWGIS